MTNNYWLELARAACDHAGIKPASVEVIRTWEKTQNTVYRLGDQRYLKLYQRNAARQFPIECAALQTLAAGGIPAPRLLAAAQPDGLPPIRSPPRCQAHRQKNAGKPSPVPNNLLLPANSVP